MSLRVLRLAMPQTVQAEAGTTLRKFGVPPGGVFDRESAVLANTLVGNEGLLPCLELPLSGGAFAFAKATNVAIVGANCTVRFCGRDSPPQCRTAAQKDDVVEIGPALLGARSYLAVSGGFDPKAVASEGGELACASAAPLPTARLAEDPRSVKVRRLRFVAGPQAGLFDTGSFAGTGFRVSPRSDRRGIRLDGHFTGRAEEIASEPACVGAIQITPSGMPILLGVDGPTIGGYPKIGCVITADLPILGQLRAGDSVSFVQVTLRGALEANVVTHLRITLKGIDRLI